MNSHGRSHFTLFRVCLVLLICTGCVNPSLFAQAEEKEPRPLPGSGTELFRGLLHFHKIAPMTLEDYYTEPDLQNVIVIVLDKPDHHRGGIQGVPLICSKVLRAGGAVLLAIEEPGPLGHYFPAATTLEQTGERVYCPWANQTYSGLATCPYVRPIEPGEIDRTLWMLNGGIPEPEWALFAGIDHLATNIPGSLRIQSPSRYARNLLAGFPKECTVGSIEGRPISTTRYFAVAGSGSGDRLPFRSLVLADVDILTNQMMAASVRGEAQNLEFANRVVQYLHAPSERTKCLFIENGVVREKFDDVRFESLQSLPPLPVPPLPDPLSPQFQQRITEMANNALTRWEDSDRPNRAVAGSKGDDGRRYVNSLRFLTVLFSVMLFLVLIRRFWNRKHEPDLPPIPIDTGRVAGSGAPGSLARRREEILQSGNYTRLIREYLCALFASRGLTEQKAATFKKCPSFEVKGSEAKTILAHLRILWDVAYGSKAKAITYSRWKELEPIIEEVRRAAEADRWRFVDPGDRA